MRFRSKAVGGHQIVAVTGVNTVSFGLVSSAQARKGLLGFAVERHDPKKDERYFMPGFKVFKSVIPQPDEDTQVSTFEHPVQSFVWDDFTAADGHDYEYFFHPIKGKPKNLDRSSKPVPISVRTEPLFSTLEHDVFFNRGVASSQAYVRRFGNAKPDKLPDGKREEALEWLSRKLDDALLAFIAKAKKGDTLLCCFYEFRYRPAADALKEAIGRGVDVRLIVDAKVNESTDPDGTFHESFPREENLRLLDAVKFPKNRLTLREAKPDDIQHNKFMVLLRGATEQPKEVWTGSTNLSNGGIHGQTNVGHWIRHPQTAAAFRDYWNLLKEDPGPPADADDATVKRLNKKLRTDVEDLGAVPTSLGEVPPGVTTVFSPRSGTKVLNFYADLVDAAERSACITLAFGISKVFKDKLVDNTPDDHIVFMLLEKEDKPNPRSTKPFVAINSSHNVYKAWGAYIDDPVYQWARETNAKRLQLNQHVSYVHSKFLLRDPLGADPIVVTGSANFSEDSTNANDENMLLIRGDVRVADIYLTEFNRLFNHYYFRAVLGKTTGQGQAPSDDSLFLRESDDWLSKYKPGTLRSKRLALFAKMKGLTTV